MRRRNQLDHFVHPLPGWKGTLNRNQLAIDSIDNWRADLEVNVRSTTFDGCFQNALKQFHARQRIRGRGGTKEKTSTVASSGRTCRSRLGAPAENAWRFR